MREWLPENFTPPEGRASEAAKMAIKRGKARRRNEKIALSCCSFLFIAAFSFMTVRNLEVTAPFAGSSDNGTQAGSRALHGREPMQNAGVKPAPTPFRAGAIHESPAVQTETVDNRPGAIHESPASDIEISKVDHSVAIKWEGEGTFAVYKCDSPKFDSCSIMEVVEGNSYLDKDENSGKIVYYRIEPLTKRG